MLGCAILWFIINHNAYLRLLPVSDIHISQATYSRCGGIFKYEFVANLPVSLPVKEFRKSVNIWGSYGQKFSVLFFWLTAYTIYREWEKWSIRQTTKGSMLQMDCVTLCWSLSSYRRKGKGSPHSITERRVPELIPVLGSQTAGEVSQRAATSFAAWRTEAQWVWTVSLRLLPDSIAAAIWTRALLRLSPAR